MMTKQHKNFDPAALAASYDGPVWKGVFRAQLSTNPWVSSRLADSADTVCTFRTAVCGVTAERLAIRLAESY